MRILLFCLLLLASNLYAQKKMLSQTVLENNSLDVILTRFAEIYFQTIGESPDFARTMLGEMTRHPEEVRQVVVDIIRPTRQQFILTLKRRQRSGEIRRGINCEAVADAFIGVCFFNIVKPPFNAPSYKNKDYIRFCVRLFVEGLKA